jgi:HEAT repeat protein
VVLLVVAVGFAGAVAWGEEAKEPSLEQAMKDLPKYEFGQSRLGLTVISDAVQAAKGDARAKLVADLAAVLGTNATGAAKSFVCRELSVAGTAREVPPLAALLTDKDLSDMARYALERIPDPAACKALLEALPKATPAQKIGIVNSLGARGTKDAAAPLTDLLKADDALLASSAATALGKIATPEAVKALAAARAAAKPEVKPAIDDGYLMCADALLAAGKKDEAAAIYQELYKPTEPRNIRIAALRGIVAAGGEKTLPLLTEILTGADPEMQATALRFLRETGGKESTAALTALLPKLPVATQAMVLDDLAARGDPAAMPAVMKAAESPDEAVKMAAVKALGALGDASAVPMLAQLALAGGPLGDAARASLDTLPGADANKAIEALAKEGDAKTRSVAIRALAGRRVTQAVPMLLASAKDADAGVRQESLKALETLADETTAPALVDLVVSAKDDADRQAAERALGTLCGRAEKKDDCTAPILAAMEKAEPASKAALVRCLGRAGGDKALAAVRAAIKDADAGVQDAAVRALADWGDPAAAADLLALAKGAEKQTHQVLALRGYIRLAGTEAVKTADALAMYKQAMDAAKRPDEKKQVLGGLGNVKNVEALTMVAPALDDPALQAEACAAAVKIAKNIGGAGKDKVLAAMEKVVATTKDAKLKAEADDLRKKAGGK